MGEQDLARQLWVTVEEDLAAGVVGVPSYNSVQAHDRVRLEHKLFLVGHILGVKSRVVKRAIFVELDFRTLAEVFSLNIEFHLVLQGFDLLHGLLNSLPVRRLRDKVVVKRNRSRFERAR